MLAILLIAANLVIFQYSERHTLEIMSDDASRNEYIDNYMSVHSQEVEEYKERIESMEDTAEELLELEYLKTAHFLQRIFKKRLMIMPVSGTSVLNLYLTSPLKAFWDIKLSI